MAAHTLADHIRARRTQKVLRDPRTRIPLSSAQRSLLDETIPALLQSAEYAPFHKAVHAALHCQGGLASRVPWRVYVLAQETCWDVIDLIAKRAAEAAQSTWARAQNSKIPQLLAGAAVVLQVNWCPDLDDQGAVPFNTANSEHIAATAAAVQNMLLTATAAGIANYWSTGGILREPELQNALGMEAADLPLATVFLSFPSGADTVKSGAMRDQKGTISDWSKNVTLAQ